MNIVSVKNFWPNSFTGWWVLMLLNCSDHFSISPRPCSRKKCSSTTESLFGASYRTLELGNTRKLIKHKWLCRNHVFCSVKVYFYFSLLPFYLHFICFVSQRKFQPVILAGTVCNFRNISWEKTNSNLTSLLEEKSLHNKIQYEEDFVMINPIFIPFNNE